MTDLERDLRFIGGINRRPVDKVAHRVTSKGPEWCAPLPGPSQQCGTVSGDPTRASMLAFGQDYGAVVPSDAKRARNKALKQSINKSINKWNKDDMARRKRLGVA